MAVVRGDVVATPHAQTFFEGVVRLSQGDHYPPFGDTSS